MKTIKTLIIFVICTILLCSCSQTSEGLENYPEFVGKWQCAEAPAEHPEFYTGYLMWRINDDGSFSMYDAEAGNPGISGNLKVVSENELKLECNMEEDFDPPVTWEDMEGNQTFAYEFAADDELRVTFTHGDGEWVSTLTFTKEE